jgi:hypothetical protein
MQHPRRHDAAMSSPRTGHIDRFRGAVCCVLLAACGSEAGTARRPERSERMPQVNEVPVPSNERVIGSVLSTVAVGADGTVLVLPLDAQGPSLMLIGARNTPPRAYGRPGEGPGEMRMPIPLLVEDTTVVGFDLATQRIMFYDRASGQVVREMRPELPVVPFMRGPGATLLASRFDRGVELPVLVELARGRVRQVLAPTDSYRVALFADDDQYDGGSRNTTVIGRWSDGVVLANGMTYRIGQYDEQGVLRHRIDRNIAPRRLSPAEIELELSRLATTAMGRTPERLARARERLEATPTRWFTHRGAPRSDGRGRLWVMVEHGDSTLADVYAGDRLLGRTRFDCPGFTGRWDLVGEWLVLLCVPVEPTAEHDAEVRRWRIVEPDR